MPDASADCAFLPLISHSLNGTQTSSVVFVFSISPSIRVRAQLPSSQATFCIFIALRLVRASLLFANPLLLKCAVPVLLCNGGKPSYSRQDSNPHCTDPKSVVSCRWTTGAKSSQRESNPQLLVRSQMFYPLNYTMLNKTVSSFPFNPVGGLIELEPITC